MNTNQLIRLGKARGLGRAVVLGLNAEVKRQCGDSLSDCTHDEIQDLFDAWGDWRQTKPAVQSWLFGVKAEVQQ